jgi:hypothetical protein
MGNPNNRKDLRHPRKVKLRVRPDLIKRNVDSVAFYGRDQALSLPLNILSVPEPYHTENVVRASGDGDLNRDNDEDTGKGVRHAPKHLPPRYDARKNRLEEDDPDMKTSSLHWTKYRDCFQAWMAKRDGKGISSRSLRALGEFMEKKCGLLHGKPDQPQVIQFLNWLLYQKGRDAGRFADFLVQEVWRQRSSAWEWVQDHHPDHKYAHVEAGMHKFANLAQWKQGITKLRNTMTQIQGYIGQMGTSTPQGQATEVMQELKGYLNRIDIALEEAANIQDGQVYNMQASRQAKVATAVFLASAHLREALTEVGYLETFVRKHLAHNLKARTAATQWVQSLRNGIAPLYDTVRVADADQPDTIYEEMRDVRVAMESAVGQWKLGLKDRLAEKMSFYEVDRLDMMLDRVMHAVTRMSNKLEAAAEQVV